MYLQFYILIVLEIKYERQVLKVLKGSQDILIISCEEPARVQ